MFCVQITICSDHAEFPDLKLTTFGTKPIFEKLRSVWHSFFWSRPSRHTALQSLKDVCCVDKSWCKFAVTEHSIKGLASMQAKEDRLHLCRH